MDFLCLAAAKTLLETFPEVPKKLSAEPFSELNFRAYRLKLPRTLVLKKYAELTTGVLSTCEIVSILETGDPFQEIFTEKHWRQVTILMVLQGCSFA